MTEFKTKGLIAKLKKNKLLSFFYPYVILTIFLFYTLIGKSQTFGDSIKTIYPFIKSELNNLQNDTSLHPFFDKIAKLEKKSLKTISIVHIGDSHIQADIFSGRLRRSFQSKFGNAGRGLLFPYRLARTNEPNSYKSESNVKWESRRNVIPNSPIKNGLCGITIKTNDTTANLVFTLNNEQNLNYELRRLTIIHDKGPETFDLIVSNDTGKVIAKVSAESITEYKNSSYITLDNPINKFRINVINKDTLSKRHLSVYGLVAENEKEGVLYHAIGVNGAEFRHYNATEYFLDQLQVLKPDLFIVSLGTNDAYPLSFNSENFRRHVDTLLTSLKKTYPNSCIILTGPGDSFRKRKYKNKNMSTAGQILRNYAIENHMAYWDWINIMGGIGSSMKWQKKNLCQPDRLHLTRSGYDIQGELLYEAILKSYVQYKKE